MWNAAAFHRSNMKTRRDAFTLIELLVAIAILGVLAGLLLPALSRGKQNAKSLACLNNLRELGVGCALYALDNGDRLPETSHQHVSWIGTLPRCA